MLRPLMRVALGTAGVLGLADVRQDVLPITAHFLEPGRCIHNCSFCTQAAGASGDSARLSRIAWPSFPEEDVLEALRLRGSAFDRACLQTVEAPPVGSPGDTASRVLNLGEVLGDVLDIPLSVEVRPGSIGDVDDLFRWGADTVGIPLDGANEEVFGRVRGGSFQRALAVIEEASAKHTSRISTHIMVGLGETERDVVELMTTLNGWGVRIGLFALTPMRGTLLAGARRPSLSSYRRVQAARFLIEEGVHLSLEYDEDGTLSGFGLSWPELSARLKPSAFTTSGCQGCNRPYYNESPGGTIYNYPRPLTDSEFTEALDSLGIPGRDIG